jgi:hypothetical protein
MIFCYLMEGSESVHIITVPYLTDPDFAGPKTTNPTDPDPEHCFSMFSL